MYWLFWTLMAAFSQAWRNALQSKLSSYVRPEGVTLARFIFAVPIISVYLFSLHKIDPVPLPSLYNIKLLRFIFGAGVMQIIATALMVRLFQLKNFTVGAGLAKSEAIIAAILGVMFYSTNLSLLGWAGVLIGAIAVFLLSGLRGWKNMDPKTILLGLSSGAAFALTSLWVRQASLCFAMPFPHRAAWILLMVVFFQTIILIAYLSIIQRQTLIKLFSYKMLTFWISITSTIGSIGWFSAMSLERVSFVKTVGQVEVFFMIPLSYYFLKQKSAKKDNLGLVLIAVAAVLVTLDKQ